jgi:hypothetical protein
MSSLKIWRLFLLFPNQIFDMSQQAVSVIVIPNSAVGNFSLKNRRAKKSSQVAYMLVTMQIKIKF